MRTKAGLAALCSARACWAPPWRAAPCWASRTSPRGDGGEGGRRQRPDRWTRRRHLQPGWRRRRDERGRLQVHAGRPARVLRQRAERDAHLQRGRLDAPFVLSRGPELRQPRRAAGREPALRSTRRAWARRQARPICSSPTTAVLCGPDLVSESPLATCSNQACVNGACGGTCVPNSTQCASNGVQTCGADGTWKTTTACAESCSDGGCGSFPSCVGAAAGAGTDCGGVDGGAGTSDCCSSFAVSGGTFYRGYDGVSPGDTSQAFPATVSSFRLDAYEATVGRFRNFVTAVVGGWQPTPGAGKHAYLNGGSGLANVGGGDAGASEPGWSMSWDSNLASSASGWNSSLGCPGATWTPGAGADEHRPSTASAGTRRTRSASGTAGSCPARPSGTTPHPAEANSGCTRGRLRRRRPPSTAGTRTTRPGAWPPARRPGPNDVGSESTAGDGKFGQSDLLGQRVGVDARLQRAVRDALHRLQQRRAPRVAGGARRKLQPRRVGADLFVSKRVPPGDP